MRPAGDAYIPALRFRWLTRYYDPLLRALLEERRFKARLVQQARVEAGQRALDLGCGTGTLTVMLKRGYPDALVVGLDGDQEALAIARAKAVAAGVAVDLCTGLSSAPPFAAATFDRVVSSLLFHHLTTDEKRRTLVAALVLLRPGGELHVADWGQARGVVMRLAFLGVQLLDGFRTTNDNVRGHLPRLIAEAGFASVAATHHMPTVFGTLSLYRAVRPPHD